MEILETIPIYQTPNWPFILMIIGGILAGIGIAIFNDTEWVGMAVLVLAVIMALSGLFTALIYKDTIFSHNEYIIRISNMPVNEFIENYEITKRFEYSYVVQVKEIVKK